MSYPMYLINRWLCFGLLIVLTLTLFTHSTTAQSDPATTTLANSFMYQGYIEQHGFPVTGSCDLQFSMFDAFVAGAQVGNTLTRTNITVNGGVFNAQLDFGPTAFNGQDRYLAISVGCPAGSGGYTALIPRQLITPVPYAIALHGLRTEPHAASPNVIGGFSSNSVTVGVSGATIAGGGAASATNRVTDLGGAIGGGMNNQAGNNTGSTIDRSYATVGGGHSNTASGEEATVGGGSNNIADGIGATISGGEAHEANGLYPTIGGGYFNQASGEWTTVGGGYSGRAIGNYVTVAGGGDNQAVGLGITIGGGFSNNAGFNYATVAGGLGNAALANFATISGGGRSNPTIRELGHRVRDDYGTVSGGADNQAGNSNDITTDAVYATVGGGSNNLASGQSGTVSGGSNNTASGQFATIAGGHHNTASGAYSFAIGHRAIADDLGTFVWADSMDAAIAAPGNNTFTVRASGGVWLGTDNSPMIPTGRFLNTSTGGYLTVGGVWTNASDRAAKENFIPIDSQAILEALNDLPITMWNYIAEGDSIQRIGPMAQDFYAAFGVGMDEISISTIDAQGVAFAAIQGLNQKLEEENAVLREHNADLEARVARLEALATGGQSAALLPFAVFSGLAAVGLCLCRSLFRGR
jgi:trimeric autotransporter adhesin